MMRHRPYSAFCFATVVAASALAQVPDPTRPPGAVSAPPPGGVGAPPVESGVQTLILRHEGKSGAVINGQYVEVGGKLGDKRVVKISDSEVVLAGAGGREVIRLTPAIEKVQAKKTAATKQPARGGAPQ